VKVTGKVERRDLEGGIWQLVSDDGQRYTLTHPPAELTRARGARVEVDGAVDEGGGFGLAMAGPQLRVRSFRVL
jgi:hypothetical protein